MHFDTADTIVALATAPGAAAIAVIRLSGPASVSLAEKFFHSRALKKISLAGKRPNTVHFGVIMHNGEVIDEVLLTLFRAPHSFTGQDTVEISCHGSVYIQQRLLSLFLSAGARMADPGEFTFRAFMNGKLDLSQAEAVADLVASTSAFSHRTAMKQMRGGFSARITELRGQLVKFASLVELELDFSEEDVEFADRGQLRQLVASIIRVLEDLVSSFELGNVIRNGVPVSIVGKPNAGKSTLLNALVGDERAIVSEIAGTTRDTIEDEIVIEGVLFRFIDTAGLRITGDVIERIGVDRAYEAMGRSAIVIYLFDAHTMSAAELAAETSALRDRTGAAEVLLVANKCDLEDEEALKKEYREFVGITYISAKEHRGLDALRSRLLEKFSGQAVEATDTIVTNARHARALQNAAVALGRVAEDIDKGITGDFLALDIRFALMELGNITGQVTSDDLLQNIFSKFCIGK